MAQAADIYAEVRLRSSSLPGDVQKANAQLARLGQGFAQLSALAQRYLVATGAAVALAVKAYASEADAQKRLRSALAANGFEVERNMTAYRAFAEQVKANTTLSVEFVASLQATALNLGVAADRVDDVVKAGIGLGERFFGGDFAQGVKAAALATQGQVRELQRMIPALRQAATLNQLLAEVNEKATAGVRQAKDETQTFAGSMKILGRDVDDARKAIGEAFAPEVVKAAKYVERVTEAIERLTPAQKANIVQWVKLTTEVAAGVVATEKAVKYGGALIAVFRGAAVAMGLTTGTAGAVVVALAAIGAAFVEATGKGETFGAKLGDVMGATGKHFQEWSNNIQDEFRLIEAGVVSLYLRWREFTEGISADKAFEGWVKSQEEEVHRIGQVLEDERKKRLAEQKKSLDAQAKLQAGANARQEGEQRNLFKSVDQWWKDNQAAILRTQAAGLNTQVNAEQAAAKKKDLARKGDGKPAADPLAVARGQENAAIASLRGFDRRIADLQAQRRKITSVNAKGIVGTDEPHALSVIERDLARTISARERTYAKLQQARDRQRQLTGENAETSGVDPARAAARVAAARKEVAKIDQQRANLARLSRHGNESVEKEAADKLLRRRRDSLQGLIDRGGIDRPDTPFSRDTIVPEIVAIKDRINQAMQQMDRLTDAPANAQKRVGLQRYIDQQNDRLRQLNARAEAGRKAGVQNSAETPADRQAQQFGAHLSDSAKAITGAAGAIEKFFKGAQPITVLRN